jgi:hypothetical protein
VHFRDYTALFLEGFIVEILPPFLLLKIEKDLALVEQQAMAKHFLFGEIVEIGHLPLQIWELDCMVFILIC